MTGLLPNASTSAALDPADHERIARALVIVGGHLFVGRNGYTLWYDRGCRLHGYDIEPIRAACVAAGLPVIDDREVAFETMTRIVISGPMIAVGEEPSGPPYHALSYAPLSDVAEEYRRAGAEVFNVQPDGAAEG